MSSPSRSTSYLIPILVFFSLKDKQRIIDWATQFLPRERELSFQVWVEVDQKIANYIRGKFIEIAIVWVVTYVTFALMGLNFSLLLSFLVGISVIIPFVGAIAVTFPVALIAYFQWGLEAQFWYLLLAYQIIQILDGNVLVPILFSEVVNLHPVAIIVAVLFFGGLWGVWGVFFAIPLATLVQAVINTWPRGQPGGSRETAGLRAHRPAQASRKVLCGRAPTHRDAGDVVQARLDVALQHPPLRIIESAQRAQHETGDDLRGALGAVVDLHGDTQPPVGQRRRVDTLGAGLYQHPAAAGGDRSGAEAPGARHHMRRCRQRFVYASDRRCPRGAPAPAVQRICAMARARPLNGTPTTGILQPSMPAGAVLGAIPGQLSEQCPSRACCTGWSASM